MTDTSRTGYRIARVVSYLCFVAVAVYAVAFLADVVVPVTVDRGGRTELAVVVDAVLLGLFGLQHTVMARPAYKRRWRPGQLERSGFVLASSLVLALVFWQWRPIPEVVWDVGPEPLRAAVWAAYLAGWLLVVAMTFAFDHAEFLGLKAAGRSRLRMPAAYRLVRHPMMTGFLIAFWATPTMSVGHLLFASLGTAYILVGVRFEERSLLASLPGYAEYAARTPRFVPLVSRRSARGIAR